MNDLRRWILGPWHAGEGRKVGDKEYVSVGLNRANQTFKVWKVAGNGLIEDRHRQVHGAAIEELTHRHDLAARHTG